MSKDKLIPDLRFPEFKNEGEWDIEELSELGELINGLTYSPEDVSDKGLLVLRSSNIQNGMIDMNDCVYVREDIKGANLSMPSDILVCVRNGSKNLIGKNAIIPKGLPLATHGAFMTVFRASNPEFVFQLFQTDYYDIQVKADLGATINSINGKNFLKYEFPVPKNPQEQQKIATCLSSLDEVIAANSQKLELLKDHKKGLMQNLFPQEGEKVPKYRFKEFEKDGEWNEKTIDTVKSILTDYVANGSFQSLRENLNVVNTVDFAFYVRLTDLRAGLGHSNQKYVDESTYKFLNKSALFGGELLMANIGANVGEVWQMPNVKKPATLAPNMIMIRFKKDIDSEFVFQYLTSDIGVANISTVISGSGHPKISKTDLRQVKVTLPPRIEEQQKIATCLSSLDALITLQAEKIEQLKLHKKGLMQDLFPKIND
jgi:type I restriction enzyme S subunit